jgi:hypothetical protein
VSLSPYAVTVRRRVLVATTVPANEEEFKDAGAYIAETGGYVWNLTMACGHVNRTMPRPTQFYANRTDEYCKQCSELALEFLAGAAPDKEG